jgi:hypothetical protein
MASLLSSDSVVKVPPSHTPDYDRGNPLTKLLSVAEGQRLAAERHFYLTDDLDMLLPFSHLDFSGPQGADADILDPTRQDNKTDFQKQNVRSFLLTDTYLMRGWVTARAWKDLEAPEPVAERTVPFLKLSYRAGPDSKLAQALGGLPGQTIRLYVKVNGREAGNLITVPYNNSTGRYEVELWGDHGADLKSVFSDGGNERALSSLDRGELLTRPDLIQGAKSDFDREGKDDVDVRTIAPACAMHPLFPLRVELAWADETAHHWDSNNGANYHYEFNMMVRGWDAYLKAGISANPHGGLGFLHYRNLLSNYFGFADSGELSRLVEPWQFDAMGRKHDGERTENFFAVDYMDLHILKNNCGIGLHRHRDNQEIFFLLQGQAIMVTADWYRFPPRERCFELRTLRSGHFCLLKPGGIHGMMNATDSDILLLMFGGYD